MLGLRFIYPAVAVLLFGSAVAVPAPAPYHNPVVGEIVHVAPAHTLGGTVIGHGGFAPRPHITLGHDANGDAILAPVTHAHLAGLGPRIQTHGMGGLTGNVLLNSVTASPHNIARGHGRFNGVVVGHHDLQRIHQSQALVRAHQVAAHEHGRAEAEHNHAYHAHMAAAAAHARNGNHAAAAEHRVEAAHHQTQAHLHRQERQNHEADASAVHGPNAHELHRAHQSAATARNSHADAATSRAHANAVVAHYDAARAHLSAGRSHQNMNNHLTAQHHFNEAQHHIATALRHAPNSHNKPNPHASIQHAHQSTAAARHSRLQVPPHLRAH